MDQPIAVGAQKTVSLNIHEAYLSGRKELAEHLLNTLGHTPNVIEAVRRLFWSPAFCDADGLPQPILPGGGSVRRLDVIGFEDRPPAVENIRNRFLRLRVTTSWFLPAPDYRSYEDYFAALSKKTRKRLNWMRNAFEREGASLTPARTEAELEEFLEIYRSQRPESAWVTTLKSTVVRVFRTLEEAGRNGSFILRDCRGAGVAGLFGFFTDRAYNACLLGRRPGDLEKYSPGYYLMAWSIRQHFAGRPQMYYLLGPGEEDYKKSFLAKPLPVYRYEVRTWRNAWAIARLYFRAKDERRKAGHQSSITSDP